MAFDTSAAVFREAVYRLGRAGLDPHEFLYEVARRIGRVVPHDASGWMTLDPDTMLPNGTLDTGKAHALVRALWRNERSGPDVNKLADIARSRSPIALIDDLDSEVSERSERIQKLLRPIGIRHELRTVLRSAGAAWGSAVLFRETASRRFDIDERAFMEIVAEEIGDGLRRSLARRPPEPFNDMPFVPGVVAFRTSAQMSAATDDALELMRLMHGDAVSTLYAVAMDASLGRVARARVRLSDGRWLLLHGSRLQDAPAGSAQMAVTFMPPPPHELMSMLLRLHGLSRREREVAAHLMLGSELEEIAGQMRIPRSTLHDHIKSTYAKLHVTTRAQLMALLSTGVTADRVAR